MEWSIPELLLKKGYALKIPYFFSDPMSTVPSTVLPILLPQPLNYVCPSYY